MERSALHGSLPSESAVGIGELVGLGIGFAVGIHGDGGNLLFGEGTVIAVGFHCGNGIDHIHAGGHLAKGGILIIQMLGVLVHDEELGACGVGGGGTGHAENAPLVLLVVLDAVEEELAFDAVAGAAHAGSLGAAALDHEAGDDAVEDQTVIEIVICQIDEIADALGRLVGVQLAFDDAAVFHGDFESGIHLNIAPSWPGQSGALHPDRPRPVFYRIVSCPCTGQPLP